MFLLIPVVFHWMQLVLQIYSVIIECVCVLMKVDGTVHR